MFKFKYLVSIGLVLFVISVPALAENIGGGSPNALSFLEQAWSFIFG